jgi:hypothetical protein
LAISYPSSRAVGLLPGDLRVDVAAVDLRKRLLEIFKPD